MIDIKRVNGDCIEVDVSRGVFEDIFNGNMRSLEMSISNPISSKSYSNVRTIKMLCGQFSATFTLRQINVNVRSLYSTLHPSNVSYGQEVSINMWW